MDRRETRPTPAACHPKLESAPAKTSSTNLVMTLHLAVRRALVVAVQSIGLALPAAGAHAQTTTRDTLQLGELHDVAAQRDPRARQLALLETQTDLRLRNIGAERLPSLTVVGQAQYQSDVTNLPFAPPGGQRIVPPNDTYDARIEAQQRLIDPSLAARREVERAQLAESQARVRTAVYGLRENVNDAFFSAARLQLERGEVETSITDLEAQLRVANDRVRLGSALPSEAATLQAEILLRRQALAEIDANRRAALTVLGDLTGLRVDADDVLALPDAAAEVARLRAAVGDARGRPEYEQFARTRELLQRQDRAVSARDKPRLSAFARAGYGQPGLNALSTDFDSYWLAGMQVQWAPWSWGTTRREREVLALQRQVVETEEAAFRDRIERSTAHDLATIDRLESAIATDDQIIALRERIVRETLRRFQEGVVTSADYVDRQTDVLNARLARASHRAELAQARARFLTLVGAEVP
jgi:outer membrane protein TolC